MLRLAVAFAVAVAVPASAQQTREQTLADIRQQLAVLNVETQKLRGEMNTTGGPGVSTGGSTVLDRVNAIETELQRLTAATERLQFRVDSVSRDGAARIEDLRFQLCELTTDCDLDTLPAPSPLGSDGAATVAGGATAPAANEPSPDAGADLAVGERGDFDRAKAALDAGDNATAARGFEAFVATYPTGPLSAEAQFLRAQALARDAQTQAAARAYLEAFSGTPEGPHAAESLVGLGTSLATLGQVQEACLTLAEVGVRFPASPAVAEANAARANLGCS